MDLRQIRYFLALCEHRNFTHAASACHVSQPSLTQSIRKLEQEFGGALVTRSRSGCQPTPLGKIVRTRFAAAMREILRAEADADRYVRLKHVPIRIGLMETIGIERLAPAIAAHRAVLPEIEFELISEAAAVCLDRLREGWFDIVIGGASNLPEELFQCEILYPEDYVVVFPRGHRFGTSDGVDLSEITEETLLDRPNCEMRDRLVAFSIEEGIELYAPYRTNNVETMKRLVSDRVGVTVLPRYSVSVDEPKIDTRPLLRPSLTRDVCAIRARSQPMRRQTADLVRKLKSHCISRSHQDAAR